MLVAPELAPGRGLKHPSYGTRNRRHTVAPELAPGRGLKRRGVHPDQRQSGRPGARSGARIETLPPVLLLFELPGRPGARSGARIETNTELLA